MHLSVFAKLFLYTVHCYSDYFVFLGGKCVLTVVGVTPLQYYVPLFQMSLSVDHVVNPDRENVK